MLTFGTNGNVNSNNYAIEMNIGEKLSLNHRASNKPLYITKTNTNNSAVVDAKYETGVKYLTQETNSDPILREQLLVNIIQILQVQVHHK